MKVPRADFFIMIGLFSITYIVMAIFVQNDLAEPICIAGAVITALIFIPLGIHYYKRDHPFGF